MSGEIFVDTNVLVCARDASEPGKQKKAVAWMGYLWEARRGRMSLQVLSEYYNTITNKLRPGMKAELARQDVRHLMAWRPLPLDSVVIEGAWTVQDKHGLSWWDSLIVSATHVSARRYHLTEDFEDGRDFDGIEVVNPFLRAPHSI